jgi:hypothetical protein
MGEQGGSERRSQGNFRFEIGDCRIGPAANCLQKKIKTGPGVHRISTKTRHPLMRAGH